jgi:predicted Ser/Thr protein kinase
MRGVLDEASAPTADISLDEVQRSFPDLEIHDLIGTGGMGRVYKARQPSVDRWIALKILSPDRANDPEWIERFTREARALARLNHPHIVQVHGFGTEPQPHLIMEFVDGVNLRQAMQAGGLSAREALVIVPKLCDALHYAHEHGVLHRDIKPENILIDTEGRVKIVDFGLAKLRDESALPFTLTQSGAKLGTLAYMAPEQIEKPAEVDHRADIYSLGVVFYEMLTGELPLGRFPSPSEASGSDPRLDSVVLKTLEKNKEKRFQQAGDLRSGIENASTAPMPATAAANWNELNYEYRSRSQIGGWPLVHIVFGKDAQTNHMKKARGIIALGNHATGVLALGVFAQGLVAWGVLSWGLLSCGVVSVGWVSLGVVSLALFGSYGVFALAPFAFGVTAIGYIAAGVKAIGMHAADATLLDARAAALSDQWSPLLTRCNAWFHGICMTGYMLVAAFAAWRSSSKQLVLMFLALGLTGILNVMPMTNANTSFARRLQQQQDKQKGEALQTRRAAEKKVWEDTLPWINQASRTDSMAERDKGFATIFQAIQSKDTETILRGLHAVNLTSEVQIDRTKFRDAIRPLLDHPDLRVRKRAISALLSTNYEPADAERVLALVPGCDDRLLSTLGFAIGTLSNRDYTGKYAAPMLSLLERGFAVAQTYDVDGELHDSRHTFNPLWGGKFSPEIEAKIVEWSRLDDAKGGMGASNSSVPYNAFYYALSTQANKSAASVKRLLELAQHPDTGNIGGRCLWGLNNTVPDKKDQATVAAFMIEHLRQREGFSLWRDGLKLIRQYASREHLPALRQLLNRPVLSKDARVAVEQIITSIEAKP